MKNFTHLHVHTQYSILDGASNIKELIRKAKADGMTALAITDHGNMFGVKEFYNEARLQKIKPIIGCEAYVAENSRFEKTGKEDRSGHHLILLAKNHTGYKNLVKLVSISYTEGFYYKPRIDKELLRKHREGIIVCSACLGGEVPQAVMNKGEKEAEKIILEFKEWFGDDYYLELQKHPSGDSEIDRDVLENQIKVNRQLVKLAGKHNIKLIASNDVHFINENDAAAHDRLICLNTGKDLDDPGRLRYTRQEYLKSPDEMYALFQDIPGAIENTMEIAGKTEAFDLNNNPIMPDFPIPEEFTNEDEYLQHLTLEGAKKRYKVITDEIRKRIDFELSVIKNMGFPGYFLIVQDFLKAAREMGVSVGPGRGSAAGSVVAYCNFITDIDPIRYNLLFERFLNPDRISMPDIDIDFDEEGRDLVLQYVVNKYGKDRVAHIITFGTMAARMAIRDVARVQRLPLPQADKLAKLVPEKPGTTLKLAYKEVKELSQARKNGEEDVKQTLQYAETLEGSVRHTGLHACGIIISKNELTDHIPVCTSKDTDLLVTQYDGNHVESVGMLKMDFLGLKTLSIIKDATETIEKSKKKKIDFRDIGLEDAKTYELFSRGETTAIFQFESPGMKKHLRELKPNRFEDLIAMNALYRPGPMEYIPTFIKRKHGREAVSFDVPVMEKLLEDTYGITVYQEQVMLLSQEMAGFSGGQADSLRKAMGKKKKAEMDKLRELFSEGCHKNGYEETIVKKIWADWEAFAQYAFNKSHSTCYAMIAYRTAWLKAHYPAEFMAAVLSRNISDIKKITVFMDECRRMNIEVLGPDINDSDLKFTVNKEGNIRFGLGAVKGVGESAAEKIIEERDKNGLFKDIFDFAERVNLHSVNKRAIEALAAAGAFDEFAGLSRYQFFATDQKGASFIENIIRYGSRIQADKITPQGNLFGDSPGLIYPKPEILKAEEWTKVEKLNRERELIGIFLSAHPLDDFRLEIENLTTHSLSDLHDLEKLKNKEITIAGIVNSVKEAYTKNGNPFGRMTLEDYRNSWELTLFGKDYINYKNYYVKDCPLLIKGRIQPKYYNEEELELKVKSMSLLANAKEDLIKSISLDIPLSFINRDNIEKLGELTENNKGEVLLKFRVIEREDNIAVSMFSRSRKISLSKEVMDFFDKNPSIEVRLN
ncbi:MAG: DNA polymerase III subunit alpha [Bacteroidales bacterium]